MKVYNQEDAKPRRKVVSLIYQEGACHFDVFIVLRKKPANSSV